MGFWNRLWAFFGLIFLCIIYPVVFIFCFISKYIVGKIVNIGLGGFVIYNIVTEFKNMNENTGWVYALMLAFGVFLVLSAFVGQRILRRLNYEISDCIDTIKGY